MDILLVLARVLVALIFIGSGLAHFAQAGPMSEYAKAKGVPNAKAGVLASGVLAVVGGLLVALGLWADLGAILLIVFLLPVSFFMHAFWKETDAMAKQTEMVAFQKNLGLIGAALLIFWIYNQGQDVPASLSDALLGRW